MLRRLLRIFVRLFFWIFTRLEIHGLENIPPNGAAILATNHLGIMDAPLLFLMLDRQDSTGLVADSYKRHPFIRWFVLIVDGIWINREEADLHALRRARNFLRDGGLLGIAPEGTRSDTGALICAKTGIAYLADRAGQVPIIPIAISGTEKLFNEIAHLHRPNIQVCIGEAFQLPKLDRNIRDESLLRNTDEIMCQIALLLPSKYWGVYAQHPRLAHLRSDRTSGIAVDTYSSSAGP